LLIGISLQLEAIANGVLTYGNAVHINDLFISLIIGEDEEAESILYSETGFEFYTLSFLMGKKPISGKLEIKEGEEYRVKFTFMNDKLFRSFYNAVIGYYRTGRTISIADTEFAIKKIRIDKVFDFETILNAGRVNNGEFRLIFLSPTNFKLNGRYHMLPDIQYVLKSYANKWNFLCPQGLEVTENRLEEIASACFADKYRLNIEFFSIEDIRIAGFKGQCHYKVKDEMEEEGIDTLSMLLNFSIFCGTGYKTALGMGRTMVRYR
jgi:CRISPR-associated endoribonuclease Cas6